MSHEPESNVQSLAASFPSHGQNQNSSPGLPSSQTDRPREDITISKNKKTKCKQKKAENKPIIMYTMNILINFKNIDRKLK